MAREAIFIDEIRQAERPNFELTISTHADVIVDIFIQTLRECFARDPIYTYVPREDGSGPDYGLTNIVIVDRYTEDAMLLPTITTTFNSANTHWIQFSQSPYNTVLKPQMNPDGSIKRDSRGKPVPSHWEYTGAYDSSITFNISTEDTIDREELTNRLHVLLAEVLRDELLVRGVFVKDISVGGQTEVPYREDFIYQVPVTAEIYSEWKRMIPVGEELKSMGFDLNVVDTTESQPEEIEELEEEFLPIHNLENEFFVEDPLTNETAIPHLMLSATVESAPTVLNYNTLSNRWEVTPFWINALVQTMIPYENFVLELNREARTARYLQIAADAIIQAETLRGIALSQGRLLPDGTKVVGNSFVFESGAVELRGGSFEDPLIFSAVVDPSNEVTFYFSKKNKNKNVLVAKSVIFDGYGIIISGTIFKKIISAGSLVEVPLITSNEVFLDGENLNTMTATDLFMIMQFAQQPFKYTLNMILEEIDKVLEELADMSTSISNRVGKITSITNIKQILIARSEKFLLTQATGL